MHRHADALRFLVRMLCVLVFVAQPMGLSSLAADQTDARRIRISRKELRKAARLGIQKNAVADYGAFAWMELSASELALLRDSGVEFEERANSFTLRLGGESFDPRVRTPVAPLGLGDVQAGGRGFHLIQFNGPVRAAWLDGLKDSGLSVVQHIPPHTYVVWGELNARERAARARSVRWHGPFVPAYRLLPRWRGLAEDSLDVRVLLYRGADAVAAVNSIKELGGNLTGRKAITDNFEVVRFSIPGTALQEVAAVSGVYTVQPVPTDGGLRSEMSNQVNVNNVDVNNLAFPGYASWLAGVGLSGQGVIVAAVDAGIQDTHPDLVNRMVTCMGSTCAPGDAIDPHGTHTAGIIAADGSSGTLDAFGFLRGLGMAPGANLVEQLYFPSYTLPFGDGMLLLMTDSYNNGASLSSNSWGPSSSAKGYDIDTMMVDKGVRDADPDTPGNQSLTYVLSIMNGYGGVSKQGTPDEAKNVFTIGSTKMRESSLPGDQLLDINDLSNNTAHGPALDGRMIPHMVAPGCTVYSTGLAGGHFLECGTSMAAPQVSGAIALFIEYYRNLPAYAVDPSPALIKAAFLPVAKDLAGNLDANNGILGHPFDSKQGWGRMDVEAVVDPLESVRYFDNPQVFDNTGEEWTIVLSVDDTSEPVRLMLVWTDAHGHILGGATPAWNNDLDLVVEVGEDTYRGNSFDANGWSRLGGIADFRNNTEGVFLGPVPPTTFTVRVVASDINSDGIPGVGDITDQDFALVCYNCLEDPGFTLKITPRSRDICALEDAVYGIEVGQVFGFVEPVTLSVSGEPAGTVAGFSDNPVTPPGASVLTVSNTASAAPGTYDISISGTAAAIVRDTNVELKLYTGVPSTVALVSPGHGATRISITPLFRWTAATQASTYTFELATDGSFNTIVDTQADLTETEYTPAASLDVGTDYYWRVRAGNACGAGGDSAVFSFTTRVAPPVLLVDDDDNLPDVRSFYTDALDALLVDYDVWDTNNTDDEPDLAMLQTYDAVIWFTGAEFDEPTGPGLDGENALASYLDLGRCLFVSSQDYLYAVDDIPTTFMSEYLGVSSAVSDENYPTVTGTGSIFAGLGPYGLSSLFPNWCDSVSPTATAEAAFVGTEPDVAVALTKDTGVYRTTFWTFAFELVSEPVDRVAAMAAVLEWCSVITIIDCNDNGIPDHADISLGVSEDCNANASPDECEYGDFDDDCDVDLDDLDVMITCFTGARGVVDLECEPTDADRDGDADLQDFASFQTVFTSRP